MNFPDDDIARLKELISEAYQAVNKRADPRRPNAGARTQD